MKKFNSLCTKAASKEDGFVNLISLGLISLLFIFVFFYLQLLNVLDTEKSTLHICRKELLQTQTEVGQDLQKLLNLNPTVLALRATKKSAQAMIIAGAATWNAPLAAAGERLLKATLKSQKMLLALQKLYLKSATFKMNYGVQSTRQKIESEINHRKQLQQTDLKSDFTNRFLSQSSSAEMKRPAVREVPSDEEVPEYELEEDFTEKQALHINWKYQHEIGSERGRLWNRLKIKRQLSCAVSLESHQNSFASLLVQVKH